MGFFGAPGWSQDDEEDDRESSSSTSGSSSGGRFDQPLVEPGSGSRQRRRDSSSDDSSSRRRRRNRDNEEPASAAEAANVGAQGQTGASVRRRGGSGRASAITGAARAPESSRAPSTSIRFTYKIQNEYPVAFFDPPNVTMTVGETVGVALTLHNPRRVAFDRMLLAIEYDPLIVRFKKVDFAPIIERLSGAPIIHFDAAEGLLAVEAYFDGPERLHAESLGLLDFEALQPVPSQSIRLVDFPFERRERAVASGFYNGRRNILGQSRIPGDGVIPLSVEVLPELDAESADESNSLAAEIARSSDPLLFGRGARGGILVSLVPERRELAVGEEIEVAVRFFNPAYSQLDFVNLQMAFDPKYIEVVDWDRGNSIALGVNIREGSKTLFPFDYQLGNEVNNRRGRIEYRMGVTGEHGWPKRADMALIKIRALRATASTKIEFLMPDKLSNGSKIAFVGRDVVGDPEDDLDGFEGCRLRILP